MSSERRCENDAIDIHNKKKLMIMSPSMNKLHQKSRDQEKIIHFNILLTLSFFSLSLSGLFKIFD